ncbi:FAD binding domain-containing protein, partial [Propylenella binzhouense]|nr:carbon monoxide dehydrogenase [Propylenella binzhouense]
MKPAPFDYRRAESVDDAIGALAGGEGDALPLAGGQSLLPLLALRMSAPRLLVDIGRIAEMRAVEEAADRVVLGAAITHAEIEDGLVPDPGQGLMRRVARKIAYRAVRNQGTIGGSIAMADPAADWPVCLIALEAVARLAGPAGRRTLAVADLIEDVYTTALEPGELIVAFEIPRLGPAARTGIGKVSRKTGAFAMSQAVAVMRDGARPARVVLAGAGGRARRLDAVSAALE